MIFLKKFTLIVGLLVIFSNCKQRKESNLKNSSSSISKVDSDDYGEFCKSSPEKCTAEYLIKEKMGAVSCLNLWLNGGNNIYIFDKYSNQYHRTENRISSSRPVTFHTIEELYLNYTPKESVKRFGRDSQYVLENLLNEVYGSKLNSLDWKSLPFGKLDERDKRTIYPKYYALKVSNALLGNREEWTIFKAIVPPNLNLSLNGHEMQSMTKPEFFRDSVASMCFPVKTHVTAQNNGNFSLHSAITALNERDKIEEDLQRLDNLYNSMVTFVEAAPLTGQISTLYKGCYLKEKSCLRSMIAVTADTASMVVLVPNMASVVGKTTYMVVASVGAAANAIEGGLLVKDSIQAAKNGHSMQSVFIAGAALLRFTAAAGLVIEYQGVASNVLDDFAKTLAINDDELILISKMNLSNSDIEVLKFYQGPGYKEINSFLRAGLKSGMSEDQISEIAAKADRLLNILHKQSNVGRTITVHRGFGTAPNFKLPTAGEIFEAKGMLSTSFADKVPTEYLLNNNTGNLTSALVEIDIPSTMRGFAMNALGKNSIMAHENEFLFASGAKFKVISSVPSKVQGVEIYLQKWKMISDGLESSNSIINVANASTSAISASPLSKFYDYFENDFVKIK